MCSVWPKPSSTTCLVLNCHFSPDTYPVYRTYRMSVETTGGRSTWNAVSDSVSGAPRTTVTELAEECVWVEIPSSDGLNLLIGNEYFAPDTTADTLKRLFWLHTAHINTHNSRVLLLGDLNVTSFHWELGRLSPAVSHYCIKLNVEAKFFSHAFTRLISAWMFLQQVPDCLTLCFLILPIFLLSMMCTC